MNGDESDKLDQIHQEVHETRTDIQVVDERTRQMQDRMDRIEEKVGDRVSDNSNEIDELRSNVRRNTTVLGAITGGFSLIGLWLADKVSRII